MSKETPERAAEALRRSCGLFAYQHRDVLLALRAQRIAALDVAADMAKAAGARLAESLTSKEARTEAAIAIAALVLDLRKLAEQEKASSPDTHSPTLPKS